MSPPGRPAEPAAGPPPTGPVDAGRRAAGLGRDRVVAAARALIEADGLEALSMRKLAADLGVAPTAIYWHVGSRQDLLNAVLDAMIADLPPVAARGRSPRQRVASVARGLLEQVRSTAVAHRLARDLDRSAELALPGQVALAREMGATGLRGAEAANAVRAVLYVVGGFVLLEDVYTHQGGRTAASDLWSGADVPGVEPRLRRAMGRPVDPDALFDYSVDRLLAGILDGGTPPAARPPGRRRPDV